METKMLNSDEQANIETVMQHLRKIDNSRRWSKLDDYMSYLEWIDDAQLIREVQYLYDKHMAGNPRCTSDHPKEQCLVPYLLDAVDSILSVYDGDGSVIDPNNKYILQYYVTFTALGDIVS